MGLMDLLQGVSGTGQGLPPDMLAELGGAPGSGLPPMAADPGAGGGGLPTVRTVASYDLNRNEPGWLRTIGAALLGGRRGVDSIYQRADNDWHGNVIGSLLSQAGAGALGNAQAQGAAQAGGGGGLAGMMTEQLLAGRPENKPLGMDEVAGFLMSVPDGKRLLGDEAFMGKLKFWVDHWNQRAAQAQALAMKGLDMEKEHSQNLYASAKDRVGDAAIGPAALNQMARYGYAPEGAPMLSQAEAWSQGQGGGGLLNMGQGQWSPNLAGGPPPSKSATSARDQLYPGEQGRGGVGGGVMMPGQASREAYTINRTAGPKARAAGMEASANQAAQTRGHIARRMADNDIPQAKWVTPTDPETGNQVAQWTGGAQSVGLGRKPEDVGDQLAGIMRRVLAGADQGKTPEQVLDPTRLKIYRERIEKAQDSELGAFFREWMMNRNPALSGQPSPTNPGQGGVAPASPGARFMQGVGLLPGGQEPAPANGQAAKLAIGQLVVGPDGRTYRVTGFDAQGRVQTEPVQ